MRQTNWYVITGAPCSGKTTVIRELERLNYQVVHEVARAYIDNELKKGITPAELKADEWAFERHILIQKVKIEATLANDDTIFFDRAVPDSIAYYRCVGLDPAEPLQKSHQIRYRKIFLFERLTLLKDPVRSEDEKIADKLNDLIEKSYHLLDYEVCHVPVLPVKARTEYILQRL